MSQSLYELERQAVSLMQSIAEAEGELDSFLDAYWDLIKFEVSDKAEAYLAVIERLKAEHEFLMSKADKFYEMAKRVEKANDGLRERLKNTMLTLDQKKIVGQGATFTLGFTKPSVDIFDFEQLPEEFTRKIVEFKPDRDKIRKALESGREVDGARLVESYSLRITPNGEQNGKKRITSKSES